MFQEVVVFTYFFSMFRFDPPENIGKKRVKFFEIYGRNQL